MKLTVLFSFLVASAAAFNVAPTARNTATRLSLMTPEETELILTKAKDCTEGECNVGDVDELLATLKEQQKELHNRVKKVRSTVQALEKVNSSIDRKPDEVRETVRAVWRIFQLGDKASGNDYPSLSRPTGWSGEVGAGPQTAYDVLAPARPKKNGPSP